MNLATLDNIMLDKKVKASINYAKARSAIEQALTVRAERRAAKNAVISFLGGVCNEHSISFPDNSKAKY